MSSSFNFQKLIIVSGLIILASIWRLVHIDFNFSPVYAIALFSTAFISDKRISFFLPLLVMLISDYFVGYHNTMVFVYGSLVLTGFLGLYLKERFNPLNLLLTSVGCSVIFFVVTNFGHWYMTDMYSKDLTGLLLSYEMGIPFYKNTLLSSVIYSFVLFYGMVLIDRTMLKTEKKKI
jgi:hypothetical protein